MLGSLLLGELPDVAAVAPEQSSGAVAVAPRPSEGAALVAPGQLEVAAAGVDVGAAVKPNGRADGAGQEWKGGGAHGSKTHTCWGEGCPAGRALRETAAVLWPPGCGAGSANAVGDCHGRGADCAAGGVGDMPVKEQGQQGGEQQEHEAGCGREALAKQAAQGGGEHGLEVPAAVLDAAARYKMHALGTFGWPMYTFVHRGSGGRGRGCLGEFECARMCVQAYVCERL